MSVGVQTPRFEFVPKQDSLVHAESAADLGGGYGLEPDGWQRHVLCGWLGDRVDGRWSAGRVGLSVPRQNGKNAVLEVRELYGLTVLGEKFLHTAHEVKTARKAFLRLAGFFENKSQFPELAGMVKEIRRTNGQEAIVLENGGTVEFVARTRGSGRGYTVDVLVCDEAQELTDEQLEALLPTISSAPSGNPQTILTGTPPSPTARSEVFSRYRADAQDGKSERLCWHEWSVEKPDGQVDVHDPDVWATANPSLGIRLSHDVVSDEVEQMSYEGFCRERLGMWDVGGSSSAIDPEAWAKLEDTGSRRSKQSKLVFGLDVSPDHKHADIAVAAFRDDGLKHVELVPSTKEGHWLGGTSWVVDRVAELVGKWGGTVVLDPASAAGSLLTGLHEAGVSPELVTGREYAQACGSFFTSVTDDGSLRHLGQPRLTSAVDGARWRALGDARAWNRRDLGVVITPLVAVTLACHGLGKPGKRRQKTGAAQFF